MNWELVYETVEFILLLGVLGSIICAVEKPARQAERIARLAALGDESVPPRRTR